MDRIIFTGQTQWATENTPAALAEAIDRKFSIDLRSVGQIASTEARQRYSWDNVFERLIRIQSQVVQNFIP